LQANGFDFTKPTVIDFKVFFEVWPAHKDAMLRMTHEYSSVSSCGTDDEFGGFLEFQVYALLTYELVINTMGYVTELMSPYRGACLSWGVEFARAEATEVFLADVAEAKDLAHSL
jgi:hypothetical protein